MLHIVNKSPFERNALASCVDHAVSGDAVILIEDAVTGAMDGIAIQAVADALGKKVAVYVLGADLDARGLQNGNIIKGAKVVDYAGFVDLVTEHDNVQTWL